MAYAALVALLLCVAPLHGARTSSVTSHKLSELAEGAQKQPICAPDIVAETCAVMLGKPKGDVGSGDEGLITMAQVQGALSTSGDSVEGLWKKLGLPPQTKCTDLCHAVKDYLSERTVLPTTSDEGCYVAKGGHEVKCGLDFSPDAIGSFVDPSRPFVPSTDVAEEKPDRMELVKKMWKRWRKKASKSRQSIVPVRNTTEDYQKYLSGATVHYPFLTMGKQLARRFRFFPAAGHSHSLRGHNASLVQTDAPGSAMRGTDADRDLASERLAQAVAYLTLAMSHFADGRVDHLMAKFFGNSDAKVEMLRVLNSISGMLENVAFAFPPASPEGSDGRCKPGIIAFVFPTTTNGVKENCAGDVPLSEDEQCVANSAGELLYFLCPKFVQHTDISEQIQTMLHEGSQHSPSSTEDVCMNEFRFGKERTEYKVVPWTEVIDEPLGKFVMTSKPEGQPLEKFTHLSNPEWGVLASVWLKHKDFAVLKLSLSDDSNTGCQRKSRAYGPQKCLDLARLAPLAAIRNADSIGYFIVEAVQAGAYDGHTCTQVAGEFCVGEEVCRTAGDKLFSGARRGTISYDMRPKHNFVNLVWDDTGEESDLINIHDLSSLEEEKHVVADGGCAGPLGLIQYPGVEDVDPAHSAANAEKGDKVFSGARRGTIRYDIVVHTIRYVKLVWDDTGEESDYIRPDTLSLEEEKLVVRLSGERFPVQIASGDVQRAAPWPANTV